MMIEDIFSDPPVLETQRLILRKLSLDDAKDVFDYARDPEVIRYLPWTVHNSIEDTITYLNDILEKQAKAQVTSWALVYKPLARVVGSGGYNWWLPEQRRAEIGYVLSRSLWGKGLMTEAVRAIIEFGFAKMNLNRIQALCREENLASVKVLEKCGMSREGLLRGYTWDEGESRNFLMYSILQGEWEGRQ